MSDGKKLVAAIVASGSVTTLREVKPGLLQDAEQELFDFISQHYRRYGALPDLSTTEQEIGYRLPRAPEPAEYYLRRVYDRRLFVDLREQFQAMRDCLQGSDLERAREVVQAMTAACRSVSPDDDVRNFAEAAEGVERSYEYAKMNPGMTGVPSGWPTLDEQTGGYQKGDLISWVARMGVGKTNLLLVQALHAWNCGYSVLIVSMEMPLEQITRRLLGMATGINPDFIRKGTLCTFSQRRLESYIEHMQRADNLHLYAGSFSKSTADVEMMARETGADIIYIDGAYILAPQGAPKSASRLDKVAATYDELKRMAITLDRPIITTSQFSRQAGKRGKDGSLETISFSDAIAMHSSLVYGIKEGLPPFQSSRRMIDGMKGREGETCEISINYLFTPVDFSEVPPEAVAATAVDLDWMAE